MPSCTLTQAAKRPQEGAIQQTQKPIEDQLAEIGETIDFGVTSLGEINRRNMARDIDARMHSFLEVATVSDLCILKRALELMDKAGIKSEEFPADDAPFTLALLSSLGVLPK